MSNTLSPRGKEAAQMKKRFIRYEEAVKYFDMEEELIIASFAELYGNNHACQ